MVNSSSNSIFLIRSRKSFHSINFIIAKTSIIKDKVFPLKVYNLSMC